MPQQSPLRLIKRWRKYAEIGAVLDVPALTRGVYILYRKRGKDYEVMYIGVAGLSRTGTSGVRSRLKSHAKKKQGWTHYSVFEVHDNVTRDEIRELEALLLGIFRDDSRIGLGNMQLGSSGLRQIRVRADWMPRSGTSRRRVKMK
jgi:hypothetical protein